MDPQAIFAEVAEKATEAGTLTELARVLNEPLTTVSNWRTRGIPAHRCKEIEALTGISVQRLRPDDWQSYWPEPIKAAA